MSETRSESITKLASKLAEIIGEVGSINHDAKNNEQGYNYTSFDAIAARLRPLLAKRKLALYPREVETSARKMQTKYREWDVIRVVLDITIVDGESGEWITIRVSGEGADAGDKQIPKAYTMALKYAAKALFLIATGDDDAEADPSVDKAGKDAPGTVTRPEKLVQAPPKPASEAPYVPVPAPAFNPELPMNARNTNFRAAIGSLGKQLTGILEASGIKNAREDAKQRLDNLLTDHGFKRLADVTSEADQEKVHIAWHETVEMAKQFYANGGAK